MLAVDHCIDLAAREMLTCALVRALTDPFIETPDAGPSERDISLLLEAWAAAGAQHQAVSRRELGLGELSPANVPMAPLIDWLTLPRAPRQRTYEAIFGLVTPRQCPPYETEYCHWTDPTYRAQQLADIAAFYHAFGFHPSDRRPDRPDHVVLELEFVARLYRATRSALEQDEAEHVETCAAAIRSFLRDHVAWWMPTFARTLELRARKLADQGAEGELGEDLRTLAGVADVLRAWVAMARIAADVEPSRQIVTPRIGDQPDDTCGGCGGEARTPG